MNLYSETGIGHLLFEQAAEIHYLKACLERHEEAASLLALYLSHAPWPVMPVDLALRYSWEAHRYGETGQEVDWIRLAKAYKEGAS